MISTIQLRVPEGSPAPCGRESADPERPTRQRGEIASDMHRAENQHHVPRLHRASNPSVAKGLAIADPEMATPPSRLPVCLKF